MSQFNQAEQQQMQIMHHVMNMDNMPYERVSDGVFSSDDKPLSNTASNSSSMMNCDECDPTVGCHNLLCTSIHASSPFYAPEMMVVLSVATVSHLYRLFSSRVLYSHTQPETPPPASNA